MKTIEGGRSGQPATADPIVSPCNFRSAGRLSNESARTLTTLHEVLARNLTNSLDVYLGTGLEVRLVSVEQLAMEDYKSSCQSAGYMLPCATAPFTSTVLLELNNALMFTMIDLLLGGSGAKAEGDRELTEIDEEILEGVSLLVAQQIERVWQPVGYSLTPGKCVKPSLAHRAFPPTERVLRVKFDVSVAGMVGSLSIAFQASLAGHLVRHIRSDHASGKSGVSYMPLPSLRKRMLECRFSLSGELPDLKVSVRNLANIQVGSILTLSAPVAEAGKLTLEGKDYFEAVPVRQGNNKAMQLLHHAEAQQAKLETDEEVPSAS